MKKLFSLSNLWSFSLFVFVMAVGNSCTTTSQLTTGIRGWKLLGEKMVNLERSEDMVKVNTVDAFDALRLAINTEKVHFNYLTVHLNDGEMTLPVMQQKVEQSQLTTEIVVFLEGKEIDFIEVNYDTKGQVYNELADLKIYGKPYHSE